MKKFFYTLWVCLYPIIIYSAVQLMIMTVAMVAFMVSGVTDYHKLMDLVIPYTLPLTAVSAVITFVPMILFYYFDKKKGRGFIESNAKPLDFLMAALGGAGIAIVLNVIIGISGLANLDTSFMEVSEAISSPPFPVILLCAGVIAPIIEELIFRGLVFNRIKYNYNAVAAIIISAIVFGIYHGNLTQGVYATLLGLCLAYVYNKTENLLVPICIHISANVIVNFYGKLSENFDTVTKFLESAAIFMVVLLLCLIFAIVGIIYFIRRKVKQ